MVIVRKENTPVAMWIIGRVIKVLTNNHDGLVRAAVIKTPIGQLERPINKLIFLPQHDQTSVDHPINGGGLLTNVDECMLTNVGECICFELLPLVRRLTHLLMLALYVQCCYSMCHSPKAAVFLFFSLFFFIRIRTVNKTQAFFIKKNTIVFFLLFGVELSTFWCLL